MLSRSGRSANSSTLSPQSLMPSTTVATSQPEIEQVLDSWQTSLARDYAAYRGHVYRVFNFCQALNRDPADTAKIAIAAVFHDLGVWSSGTLDYLEPSVTLAKDYLAAVRKHDWEREVAEMIRFHHKLRPYREPSSRLVELFRRADLIDVTQARVRFGLPSEFVREVGRAFPTAGFHRRLVLLILRWSIRHPLNPLPMLRW